LVAAALAKSPADRPTAEHLLALVRSAGRTAVNPAEGRRRRALAAASATVTATAIAAAAVTALIATGQTASRTHNAPAVEQTHGAGTAPYPATNSGQTVIPPSPPEAGRADPAHGGKPRAEKNLGHGKKPKKPA